MLSKFTQVIVVVALGSNAAVGQITNIQGGRAPANVQMAVGRAALTLPSSDRSWEAAAAPAVKTQSRSVLLPPRVPGEPIQIGIHSVPPGGPIGAAAHGVVTIEGSQLVWRVRVDAAGAAALRLHWIHLKLAPGSSIIVSGRSMSTGYVIRAGGSMNDGTEWTPVLDGSSAFVEYRGSVQAGLPPCLIDQVSEIAPPWPLLPPSRILSCEVNAQCQSVDPIARDAVGWMVYSNQSGTFVCTGTLLNDTDPSTTRGWFLTSSRCINTQAAAASLTVYWFYQTPACDDLPPDTGTLPVSQGATLLASSTASSVSFLQLAQDPSAGQGLAGWTTDEPVGKLWSIHHPLGTFKRVASGLVTTLPPICTGMQSYFQYHYVDYTLGTTEDGSTGAPLFNSQWQVVGQLFGTCSIATPACDNPSQWNAVFGRFNRSFPLVSPYLTGSISPARIYVNAAATGAGTGLTWADAFPDLAAALRGISPPAGGTEVWVAQGVYTPALPGGSPASSFNLTSGVHLFGGFAGFESSLSERNIDANPTILSGDLNGDDGPGFSNRSDNVYHVVRGTGVDSTAELNGFTIRGGNSTGAALIDDRGGGLYVESGSPRIQSCLFQDNNASFGGGGALFNVGGIADVQDCIFIGNQSSAGGAISMIGTTGTISNCAFESNTSTGNGGAIDLYDSSPTVSSCTFHLNAASSRGGAVQMFPSGAPVFQDCRFDQNTAGFGGGGANTTGAIASFRRCLFLQNTATFFAGAILHTGNAQTTVSACRFLGNSSSLEGGAINANSGAANFDNCEFSGNSTAANSGGALFDTHACVATVRNCTFSRNVAAINSGGIAIDDGSVTLTNSILWGNTDPSGTGQDAQVRVILGTLNVTYSDIQGLTGSLGGAGNIGADPLLTSPLGQDGLAGTADDDLLPGPGSPAIDSGDSTAAESLAIDVRGHARREDDICTTDTGAGPTPIVDMGAIERLTCVCFANCDGSTVQPLLSANDFTCFLNQFAVDDPAANCDGSTVQPILNANDFTCFLNAFVLGCS